ncbi:MAG: hypothetical protein BWY75_03577 [bacterium ADurb.Bin425]|jgi:MFS superfamily sulfate permease-like transporter|nr:MAG: hypothetical protein BWY75_03577 [bacterium ADurb.Bin425]
MSNVLNIIFFAFRVLALTFAVGLIFPAFDNILLAPGVENAFVVASVFAVLGTALSWVRKLVSRAIGGVVGLLIALVGFFLMPAVTLMAVSSMLPNVLLVKTFGAAFGAGLITLLIDLALALAFGVVLGAILLGKAREKARQLREIQLQEEQRQNQLTQNQQTKDDADGSNSGPGADQGSGKNPDQSSSEDK